MARRKKKSLAHYDRPRKRYPRSGHQAPRPDRRREPRATAASAGGFTKPSGQGKVRARPNFGTPEPRMIRPSESLRGQPGGPGTSTGGTSASSLGGRSKNRDMMNAAKRQMGIKRQPQRGGGLRQQKRKKKGF